MKKRPEQIHKLFDFLKKNHSYNTEIQQRDIQRTLRSYDTTEKRALRLLHEIINTQSQPDLDEVMLFFQALKNYPEALQNLKNFLRFLDPRSVHKNDLFTALKAQPGWGPKTSALFVRNLAFIADEFSLSQNFWTDMDDLKSQIIYLPVDKVILAIFSILTVDESEPQKRLKTFDAINAYLLGEKKYSEYSRYTQTEMLIWDDLWFWGFITQRSEPKNSTRKFIWNEAKYWSIPTAPKCALKIEKVKELAEEFRDLTDRAQ